MRARSRSRERTELTESGRVPAVPWRTQGIHSPGGEGSERRPETSHPSLPPFPESLFHQFALRSRIQTPKAPFSRLVLRAGHFQKVAVEREVVSDGVLKSMKHPVFFLLYTISRKSVTKAHRARLPVGLEMVESGLLLRNTKRVTCVCFAIAKHQVSGRMGPPASPCRQCDSRDSVWWYGRRCRWESAVCLGQMRWPGRSAAHRNKVAWTHPGKGR